MGVITYPREAAGRPVSHRGPKSTSTGSGGHPIVQPHTGRHVRKREERRSPWPLIGHVLLVIVMAKVCAAFCSIAVYEAAVGARVISISSSIGGAALSASVMVFLTQLAHRSYRVWRGGA